MGISRTLYDTSVRYSLNREFIRTGALKVALSVLIALRMPSAKPDLLSNFADSMSGASGMLAGFLLTAMALVYSLTPRPQMQVMRERGHFRILQWEAVITVACLIVGCFVFAWVRLCPEQFRTAQVALAFAAVGALFLIDLCRKYLVVMHVALGD